MGGGLMQVFIIITIIMIIVESIKTNHQIKHPGKQQLEMRKRWQTYDQLRNNVNAKLEDSINSLKKNK